MSVNVNINITTVLRPLRISALAALIVTFTGVMGS